MQTAIHSPFRYAGGKYYARKLILAYLPSHTCYVEPFAGGGSIFFAKNKVQNNILNDIDQQLIEVYRFIRDEPTHLIEFLAKCASPSKESHCYYKNEFVPETALQRAGRWYYLNRTSYSGIMKMQNCFFGYGDKFSMRPQYWPRAILAASQKLQDVALTCDDFEQVIESAPDDAMLFVDPPYFDADQDKFYTKSFTLSCHERLSQTLHKHRNRVRFLLTYDNSQPVRDLYRWAAVMTEEEWNYCISRSDDQKTRTDMKGKRGKGKEVFIRNYTLNDHSDSLFHGSVLQ